MKKGKKTLDAGKAILINKLGDSPEEASGKGTRQFETVGELMEFRDKRERAKEKARQRYEEQQQKQNTKKDKKAA